MSKVLSDRLFSIISNMLIFFALLIISGFTLFIQLQSGEMTLYYIFCGISAISFYFGAKFLIQLYALKDSMYLFIPQAEKYLQQFDKIPIDENDSNPIQTCKLYASGISPRKMKGASRLDRTNYYRDLKKGIKILLEENGKVHTR